MRLGLVAIQFAFCTALLAQDLMINMTNLQGSMVRLDATYNDIKGSAYIYEDFKEGYVKYPDNTVYGVFMRFNKYTGEIEYRLEVHDGEQIMELDHGKVIEVGMNRLRPQVYEMTLGQLKGKWAEIVVAGKIFKIHKNRITQNAQPGYNSAKLEKRFADLTYYTMEVGGTFRNFQLKKQDVLDLLEDPARAKAFAKKNKLKWNDEKDVVKIIMQE